MAREITAYGIATTNIIVPPGASNAVLLLPIEGEISLALKLFSGGSLEIFRAATGATVANGALTAGTGYMMGTNEIFNATGCPRLNLVASGATAIVAVVMGISQPG